MEYKIVELEKFFVAGFSMRTTYHNNQNIQDISTLWTKLVTDESLQNISNRIDSDKMYCVYSEWLWSEVHNVYDLTITIGWKVSSLDNIPAKLHGITVPAAKYRKYSVKGELQSSLISSWVDITIEAHAARAFNVDFDEIESDVLEHIDKAIIDIYVSVK